MLYIFFVKQKTAYEMRISDWSSDVCSSDLHILVSTRGLAHAHRDVERELTDRLPPERIRVATGSFMVALVAAARSDLILTAPAQVIGREAAQFRSEEHTSELQSLMRISYAVFCLKKKTNDKTTIQNNHDKKKTTPKQPNNTTTNQNTQ